MPCTVIRDITWMSNRWLHLAKWILELEQVQSGQIWNFSERHLYKWHIPALSQVIAWTVACLVQSRISLGWVPINATCASAICKYQKFVTFCWALMQVTQCHLHKWHCPLSLKCMARTLIQVTSRTVVFHNILHTMRVISGTCNRGVLRKMVTASFWLGLID